MSYNLLFREQGYLVLNNLKQFNKSPEQIETLIPMLSETAVAFMIPLFNEGCSYFKRHGEFPSGRYFMSSDFSDMFQLSTKPYSDDVFNDFQRTVQYENVSLKSKNEIDSGNLESALSTLSEFNSIRSQKKERLNISKFVERYQKAKAKGIGMLTGILELDNILRGYDYGTLNVVAAPAGSGKCVKYNAVIHTNRGYLDGYQLERYVDFSSTNGVKKEGTFYPFTKDIYVKDKNASDKFYYNGFKNTIKLHSKYFDFEATPIHRVKVLGNTGVDWKELKDISVGDWICCDNKVDILFDNETPKPSFLSHLSERDYGWFCGFFFGDGSISCNYEKSNYSLSFTKLEQIIDYIKDDLIPNVHWCKNKKNNSDIAYSISHNSKNNIEELVELGLCGTSHTKKLPEWVYSSNKEFLIGFLSGYVDSDGGIESHCVSISSMSTELIYGIRDIFNLFGVFPDIKDKNGTYKNEKHISKRLTVNSSYKAKLSFLDLKVDYKKTNLELFLSTDSQYNNRYYIPFVESYKKEIESLYKTHIEPVYSYQDRRNLYRGAISIRDSAKEKNRDKFTRYGWDNFSSLLPAQLETQIKSDLKEYQFYQVESIEHSKAETYDISVPANNTYTANGIVSHNTSYAVSIVYNAVMNEKRNFIFFSLEVMDWHVYYSFLSRHSKEIGLPIKASEMKKTKLDKQHEAWFETVGNDFNAKIDGKLFIITQDDFTQFNVASIEKIINECDAICKARGEQLDGFVFDYLQLTKFYKPPSIRDEKEVMNYYTRYMLELSTSYGGRGLIGILLAQVNRTGSELLKKSKDATLFAFAEANELERSAHTAIVLFATDDMKMIGNLNFYVVKNRIGETLSTPTTVPCDYAYYKIGNTSLVNIVMPENNELISEIANENMDFETGDSMLDEFNSLLNSDDL